MAKASSVIKSSISGIKTKNIVEIPFTDTQLEIDAVFNCELPPQRMVTDALRASTTTKGGKDRTDPMTFAKKIFVPCVMSWSFEEDCTVEAKMDFCGDDAILNKMAQQFSMKLMKMVQPNIDEEEGN